MNFQILLTFVSFFHILMAVPIPNPAVVTVTAPPVIVTDVVPVAEVHISNGHTYTVQLTTLRTATTTYSNLYQDDYVSTSSSTITPAPAPTAETNEAKAAVAPDAPAVSTYVYTSDGVVHVEVTLLKNVIVNQYGSTISVSTQQLPTPTPAPAPAETTAKVVQNEQVQYNQASDSNTPATENNNNTSAPTSAPELTTSSSESESESSSSTITSDSISSTSTPSTSTTSSSIIDSSSSTSSTSTASSVTTEQDTSASTSALEFVTTWPNGEVFYSSLPETLVGTENVAPHLAATTTTLANTADAKPTSTGLSLVSSGTKLVLAALTEGLPMDKNVQNIHADPATIAITNTMSVSTPIITTPAPTPTPTQASNAVATNAAGVLQDGSSDSSSSSSSSDSDSSSAPSVDSSKYLTKTPNSIVYSPYNNDGSCKNYQSVLTDLTLIKSKGIQEVRIYGNDCNYMATVLTVCKMLGLKVNQGFWISSAGVDSIDSAVDDLIKYITSGAANFGWEIFSYLTVGNEAVISNYCTVDALISKIAQVKGQLQAAGYTGQITTSEPPVTFENHPELCTQSAIDFVGINPHSYFDASSSAADAGTFVAGQIGIVKQYCGSKNIVVTETGYPNQGNTNGANVPSPENQLIAVQSILDVVGTDVTILTTFADLWKNPGPYNIEQNFGIIQLLQ
jgi:exo-beta-1,3-glucanase (GH17 family)